MRVLPGVLLPGVFTIVPAPAVLASCGCEKAQRPCVQDEFATLPVTLRATNSMTVPRSEAMELNLQHCWGCSGPADVLPALLIGLLLTAGIRAWRRVKGSDRLIVARLDLLAGRNESRALDSGRAQIAAEDASREPFRQSAFRLGFTCRLVSPSSS